MLVTLVNEGEQREGMSEEGGNGIGGFSLVGA